MAVAEAEAVQTHSFAADLPRQNARVFVGLPHYGDVCAQAIEGLLLASQRDDVRWSTCPEWCSILTHNFNILLCKCLNSRQSHSWTHFGLHHADIEAEAGWIDKLLEEMDKVGADVISTVIPIKDHRGLTTTGWMEPDSGNITRFTMREIFKLPVTFDASIAAPGKWLLVNSGLWLCRLGPWIDEFPGFEFRNHVRKCEDGKYRAHVLSEDWAFSEWCARKGLKIYATRAVKVKHHGKAHFVNEKPWGEWETDRGDLSLERNATTAVHPDGADAIHGWMSAAELDWLREQAKNAKVIVEVGCWHGRSTRALAGACPGVVYTIDHFQGSPEDIAPELADATATGPAARAAFKRNLADHLETGKVVLIDKDSVDGILELVRYGIDADMVFLDGAHDVNSVRQDIQAALSVLAPNGLLCGHDIDRQGVRQAVAEECPEWLPGAGSIWRA